MIDDCDSAGAGANFLAPILQLSTNAFRAILEIDVMGSWNTVKATVPYLLESAKRNQGSSKSRLANQQSLAVCS